MIYRIVQYIQPWEIDDLERQINQLIHSSYFLDDPKKIILDVTMNLDIIDWESSKIPKQYFVNKFNYLYKLIDQYYQANFDTDINIKGCTDKRRVSSELDQDFIIWLDSDIYFSRSLLPTMINACKYINAQEDSFILSPQTIRYWDSSWDCLTNHRYLNQPHNHRDFFDLYSLDTIQDDVIIKHNSYIKFGGGWFNLFTNSVFKKSPLPIELGPYSPDDTYTSYCASFLGIKQYILDGVVVSELGKRFLEDKDYLKSMLTINTQEKNKITDPELYQLVNKFIENKK